MSKKHGIYYSARKLAGNGWGILVAVYKAGKFIEKDQNSMPWPSEKLAIGRAKELAEIAKDNEPNYSGLPVLSAVGEKWLKAELAS